MTLVDQGGWKIVGQGAVNQYHEVVVLGRGEQQVCVWLPRDADVKFVAEHAHVAVSDPERRPL